MKLPGSSRSLWESFSHAWDGLVYVYRSQRNMRIHLALGAFVVGISIAAGLGYLEFLMVILAIAAVLSAEVVNTLAESMVDLVQPHHNQIAKTIKDVAAAGVLLTAFFAVVIGFIAFYPALLDFRGRIRGFCETRWPYFSIYTVAVTGPFLWGVVSYWRNRKVPPGDL